jgi:two-component system, NarL family, invasion response regulator UvrY
MKKILIVDDHEVVRAGVMRFVERPGVVFGEASTADQALQLIRDQDWDLAVLDLSLGGRNGLELLKELKQTRSNLPVLILSMHSDEQYARRAFKAGAAGYITKNSPREELIKAVDKVIEGGRYVNPATAERLALDLEKGVDYPMHHRLSNRELQVVCMLASGKTVGGIAVLLKLSDKTVSTYRARILEKMGMRTTAEIIHYAIRNNLAD